MTTTAQLALVERVIVDIDDIDDIDDIEDMADMADITPLTATDLGSEIIPNGELHWDAFASSAAETCIARFAAHEADVSSSDIVGLGRISGVRFPRLGGVLQNRIQPGSVGAALLESATARTIRAGYQTAVAMGQVARVSAIHSDADDLWEAFVPTSYRIPRRVAATAWEVCRFDDFWVDVLEELGLERDALRFANGQVSALSRSIRGLSTVGMMLALSERGGRHDRRATRPRPLRGHRSGRGMPRPPRAAVAS
jgi:hypothetical protein